MTYGRKTKFIGLMQAGLVVILCAISMESTCNMNEGVMMKQSKTLLITGIMALFSAGAAAAGLPGEIFQPRGAKVVKADAQSDGGYEAEFRIDAGNTSVAHLVERVREHARRHGFEVVESDIKNDDADLKFKRRDQALDVSIERNRQGVIEYKADLD
ncbi:Uncharacterised protein [Neisseria zoodegmatis]|uniref:Uncharacterized protein n=3 Tax=Neisseria TaxID=482 RepID=A0A378WUH0_9NEIS|nr:Uncharacterised protein [Neisseria zoodegmatis]SUA44131.1 Uncharacterised protein [Neisseria zoodegmatis]